MNAFDLFNLQGQKITTIANPGSSIVEIPVNHLAQGIYHLRITTDRGTVSKKLVVHR